MHHEELEQRVDDMLLSLTRGEKLSDEEENILAYGYYAAGRRSTVVRVRPPREG